MNRAEDRGVCGERTAERVGVSWALMTDWTEAASRHTAASPVALTARIHNRSWQPEMSRHSKVHYFWNAFTRTPPDHTYNFVSCFSPHSSVGLCSPCLIVCHLPAKWAARHGQAFHLTVMAAIDHEWHHQNKEKGGGKKWLKVECTGTVVTAAPFYWRGRVRMAQHPGFSWTGWVDIFVASLIPHFPPLLCS